MTLGMLDGVVKQMVSKFSGVNADDLITNMKKQPQANQLFGMMRRVGLNEDMLKKMINAEIISRRK